MAGEKVKSSLPSAAVAIAGVTGSAGGAATLGLAAPGAGYAWTVGMVRWSYDAEPTGGGITISDGTTAESYPITAAGPGFLPFDPPAQFKDNGAVTITLAAPGGSVVGKVGVSAFVQKAGGG